MCYPVGTQEDYDQYAATMKAAIASGEAQILTEDKALAMWGRRVLVVEAGYTRARYYVFMVGQVVEDSTKVGMSRFVLLNQKGEYLPFRFDETNRVWMNDDCIEVRFIDFPTDEVKVSEIICSVRPGSGVEDRRIEALEAAGYTIKWYDYIAGFGKVGVVKHCKRGYMIAQLKSAKQGSVGGGRKGNLCGVYHVIAKSQFDRFFDNLPANK